MARHYVRLVEEVSKEPGVELRQVEMLSGDERERLLEEFNATAVEVRGGTLPEWFEEQVKKTPEAVAVVYGEEWLSYGELNARANRLARYLIGRGVGPEGVVGIAMERSLELMVGLWGTLKAGAAYLPLDPSYPAARLAQMAGEAGPVLVLSAGSAGDKVRGKAEVVALDDPKTATQWSRFGGNDITDEERVHPLLPEHPAYVIYTSGSSGDPKGVVICHRELANYLSWAGGSYGSGAGMGTPVNTSLSFDATVTSLFVPMVAGERVALLKEERQLEELAELLGSGAALGLIKVTPGHLRGIQELIGERVGGVRVGRGCRGRGTNQNNSELLVRPQSGNTDGE